MIIKSIAWYGIRCPPGTTFPWDTEYGGALQMWWKAVRLGEEGGSPDLPFEEVQGGSRNAAIWGLAVPNTVSIATTELVGSLATRYLREDRIAIAHTLNFSSALISLKLDGIPVEWQHVAYTDLEMEKTTTY